MRQAAVCSSITDSLVAWLLEHIPEENMTKISQEEVKIMAKAFPSQRPDYAQFLRSQHLKQLGLPGYQYTRGWGLQSSKKEGSPFRMFSRTDRTRTAKQQVLRPEIPTDKEESPSHLRRRLVLTHCGREDLWKWTIFNTILTSPKSWLSQEDLDAGFEHSLMPMDS